MHRIHSKPNAKLCASPFLSVSLSLSDPKGDICDCRTSGMCLCKWSRIRSEFDTVAGDDSCIGPSQVRELLVSMFDYFCPPEVN